MIRRHKKPVAVSSNKIEVELLPAAAWLFTRGLLPKELGLTELPHAEKAFCLAYELAMESPKMRHLVAPARTGEPIVARGWTFLGIPDPTFVFRCEDFPKKHWLELSLDMRQHLMQRDRTAAPIIGSALMWQILHQWRSNKGSVFGPSDEDDFGLPVDQSQAEAFYRKWETPDLYDYSGSDFVRAPWIHPFSFYALIEIDPWKSRNDLRAEFQVALEFHKTRKSPEWFNKHSTFTRDALKQHFRGAKKEVVSRKDSYVDRLNALGALRLKRLGSPAAVKKAIGPELARGFASDRVFYKRATAGKKLVTAFNNAVRRKVFAATELPF